MSDDKTSTAYANARVSSPKHGEVTIKAEVPAETFIACEERAVKELGADVEMPGFRKGHAPLAVLRGKLDPNRVLDYATHLALSDAYQAIVRAHAVRVLTPPHINVTKLALGSPLAFEARVGVFPDVNLPDYKKIGTETVEELKRDGKTVSRGETDQAILKALVARTKLEISPLAADFELARMKHELTHALEKNNQTLEDYFKKLGKTEVQFFDEERGRIVDELKGQIIVQEIAERERVAPDALIIEDNVTHMTKHYPDVPRERLRAYVKTLLTYEAVFKRIVP